MNVDLKFLQSAHYKVAILLDTNLAYLPIFERIEKEIALLEAKGNTIDRARAIAALYKAAA